VEIGHDAKLTEELFHSGRRVRLHGHRMHKVQSVSTAHEIRVLVAATLLSGSLHCVVSILNAHIETLVPKLLDLGTLCVCVLFSF
jgi:hypothetical protein